MEKPPSNSHSKPSQFIVSINLKCQCSVIKNNTQLSVTSKSKFSVLSIEGCCLVIKPWGLKTPTETPQGASEKSQQLSTKSSNQMLEKAKPALSVVQPTSQGSASTSILYFNLYKLKSLHKKYIDQGRITLQFIEASGLYGGSSGTRQSEVAVSHNGLRNDNIESKDICSVNRPSNETCPIRQSVIQLFIDNASAENLKLMIEEVVRWRKLSANEINNPKTDSKPQNQTTNQIKNNVQLKQNKNNNQAKGNESNYTDNNHSNKFSKDSNGIPLNRKVQAKIQCNRQLLTRKEMMKLSYSNNNQNNSQESIKGLNCKSSLVSGLKQTNNDSLSQLTLNRSINSNQKLSECHLKQAVGSTNLIMPLDTPYLNLLPSIPCRPCLQQLPVNLLQLILCFCPLSLSNRLVCRRFSYCILTTLNYVKFKSQVDERTFNKIAKWVKVLDAGRMKNIKGLELERRGNGWWWEENWREQEGWQDGDSSQSGDNRISVKNRHLNNNRHRDLLLSHFREITPMNIAQLNNLSIRRLQLPYYIKFPPNLSVFPLIQQLRFKCWVANNSNLIVPNNTNNNYNSNICSNINVLNPQNNSSMMIGQSQLGGASIGSSQVLYNPQLLGDNILQVVNGINGLRCLEVYWMQQKVIKGIWLDSKMGISME